MKTRFYAWETAPFTDRLSVYDNYCYLCDRDDKEPLDFEDFDWSNRHRSFYDVANEFGVYD